MPTPSGTDTVLTIATEELVQLDIRVREEEWLTLFDRLVIFRSRDTADGPYEVITADNWEGAYIPKSKPLVGISSRLYNIVGKRLNLRVNEVTDVTITFTGVDPIPISSIITDIIFQGLNLVDAYYTDEGEPVIFTTQAGTAATLRVVPDDDEDMDAAPILGLPTMEPKSVSFGKDASIALVQGTQRYIFSDLNGKRTYYYKTCFRNTSTDTYSEYSPTFTGATRAKVDPALIAIGIAELVNFDGSPLEGREVRIYNTYISSVSGDKVVAGGALRMITDREGRVEFPLMRGIEIDVAVTGTALTRKVTVPTDQAVQFFNLFDPTIGGDDNFRVQVPEIEHAIRRSL